MKNKIFSVLALVFMVSPAYAVKVGSIPASISGNQNVTTLTASGNASAAEFIASGNPGFSGNGSALTSVLPYASSAAFVNTSSVINSSYTFNTANSYMFLATATISGTRAGEDLFLSASVSIGSTGTNTTFCCGIYINSVFPSGESYRCQQFSNFQSNMTLNPIIYGAGTAGSTSVSMVCSVSQVAVGYQQLWSVRVNGIGL